MNAEKGVKGFVSIPLERRFWSKVLKSNRCWLWQGVKDQRGYGQIWVDGHHIRAHRIAWELANQRTIPNGLLACHRCDVPSCVRPSHIFIGTMSDNLLDASRKRRLINYTYPERLARGERNGMNTHPERRPRGANNGAARYWAARDKCRRGHLFGARDAQGHRRCVTCKSEAQMRRRINGLP